MSNVTLRKILILAANPRNSSELRLGEEVREISEGLKRAQHHSKFELVSKWAVRSRDFYRSMLDIQPHVAHFSGHGVGENGLVLEDEEGKATLLTTSSLENLFKLFANRGLECVLLNACFSKLQAEAISQHISYVIGMNNTIGDKASIIFSVAFYDALGAGETIEFAFDLACVAIQIANISENFTPVLIKKTNTNHATLSASIDSSKGSKQLTVNQYKRLERERDDLQETYDIYRKKKVTLSKAQAIETDVSVKLKLDMQINETDEQLSKLKKKLNLIEQQLS